MTSEDRPLPPRAAAIAAATGTDFPEWVERIDALGGRELDHASIARQLPERFGIGEWWAQSVTVAYEQHIGRREVGQTCTGEYAASASRTVEGALDEVAAAWAAFADAGLRERLGLGEGRPRSTERWRYWRTEAEDGSQVSVNISARPVAEGAAPRCTVAVEHKGLETAEARAAWKSAWTQALAEFADRPAAGARLPAPDGSADPWQWLEDVTGDRALAWVRERNARAEAELDAVPGPDGEGLAATLQREIREILDAKDRIPAVVMRGEHLYNLWTDAEHERGLWRRTTLDSYRTEEPEWEVLLDVDALGEAEGESWVWHGASLLRPAEGEPYRRALVTLSRGGSDADVTREFDLGSRAFVPESEGGFVRPEAKGHASWIDEDTLLVATDFGEGTLTTSGYPRQARIWRRGTPLTEAELVFEAAETDMGVFVTHDPTPGWERDWVIQMHAFYDATVHLLDRTQSPPRLQALPVPRDMETSTHRDLALLLPRSDWEVEGTVHPAGSLVVADLEALLHGQARTHRLFTPTPTTSLQGMTPTRSAVVLTVLEDVVDRLEVHHREADGAWSGTDLYPDLEGALGVSALDATVDDRIWVTATGFTTPARLLLGDLAPVLEGAVPEEPQQVKSAPERFDASGLEVTQHFAASEDGTRVPYFQIGPADAEGPSPTLLYGYGGFEVSLTPSYLGAIGKAWCERGGTYVVANIRGGGEYGPAWHQAALRENRHRAYEDFAAVARDLVERGVTDRAHLGVRGGSNGGLLTGNMLTQHPELFGAVVIQVPLLDMKRYSHLLAGASWMAEYGDPDTEDWEFLRTFSPYHLLREDVAYPPALVLTSTRDDRVHPGHARKFVAALESLGADVRSYENIEGGHGGAATTEQAARMNALLYTFLWACIGRPS